jgi:hypothetical protein
MIKTILSDLKDHEVILLIFPHQRNEFKGYPCIEYQDANRFELEKTNESFIKKLQNENFDLIIIPYGNVLGIGYGNVERFVSAFVNKKSRVTTINLKFCTFKQQA